MGQNDDVKSSLLILILILALVFSACQVDGELASTNSPTPSESFQSLISSAKPTLTETPSPTLHLKYVHQTQVALATNTPTLIACDNDLEIVTGEIRTYVMNSYFNEDVRQAMYKNDDQRLNASYLDLETGHDEECRDTDIFYRMDCGSMCYPLLLVMNGAISAIPINQSVPSEPTLDDCIEMLSDSHQQLVNFNPGWYTCVMTIEGRIGWIRADDNFMHGMEEGMIQLSYWLWDYKIKSE